MDIEKEKEFRILPLSQDVRDLELATSTESEVERGYIVESPINFAVLSSREQLQILEDFSDRFLACSSKNGILKFILLQPNFETFYSGVRFFTDLSVEARACFLEVLLLCVDKIFSGLEYYGEQSDLRNALHIVVYFLAKLTYDIEKMSTELRSNIILSQQGVRRSNLCKEKLTCGLEWTFLRKKLLAKVQLSLKNFTSEKMNNLTKIWKCGLPEEGFINLYWQLTESIVLSSPNEVQKDKELKTYILTIISLVAHKFHSSTCHLMVSSFSHSLAKNEKFSSILVSILHNLWLPQSEGGQYEDTRFARALILEISKLEFENFGKDISVVKFIGRFLEEIAEKIPELALNNLSLLLPHLSAEPYPIRSSLVKAIAHLVRFLKAKDESSDEVNSKEASSDAEWKNLKCETHTTRDRLLDILLERAHDVSSYVRASALQTWSSLTQQSSIPLTYFHLSTDMCIERINDKSSIVRKQAISSLTHLVLCNPFNKSLNPVDFIQSVSETEQWLELNKDSEIDGAATRIKEKLSFLRYCQDALQFIAKVEQACKAAKRMQYSKIMSDVLESMRFLTVAHKFGIPGAKDSSRQLLCLIWDDRESGRIKKALLEMFEQTYVMNHEKETEEKILFPPSIIASNLVALASNSSLAELTSLEKILTESISKNGILGRRLLPYSVIDELWNIASLNSDEDDSSLETSSMLNIEEINQSCRAALCLLACLSSSKVIAFNKPATFSMLMEIGFGKSSKKRCDYALARFAFIAFSRYIDPSVKAQLPLCFGDEQKAELINAAEEILTWSWEAGLDMISNPNSNDQWYPAAEEAVNLIFGIHSEPETAFTQLFGRMHKKLFAAELDLFEELLSRLVFVLGHVAVKIGILAEEIAATMKSMRAKKSNHHIHEKGNDDGLLDLDAGEDEFEDGIVRRLVEMAEPSSLTAYIPIMQQVLCGKQRAGARLRASCASAFCKLMTISEQLSESHLPFILTVLRDADDLNVRSNIIIALGDLASRFPNVLEPYTSYLYKSLRDHDRKVRKNTLMVLTHLILNDMIKERGEFCELALCLEDEDERIRDLSGLFFTELSSRGTNPVYNLLPDTLYSLSKLTDSSKFERIAKFLLLAVSSEKKVLSIAEKLCLRISVLSGVTHEEVLILHENPNLKQIQDLSYCLSQMKYGDKSIQKMGQVLFKYYKPALVDTKVYHHIHAIAKRPRQYVKSEETRNMMDEWCKRLEDIHMSHKEDLQSTRKAQEGVDLIKSVPLQNSQIINAI